MNKKLISLFVLSAFLLFPIVIWAVNFPNLNPGGPVADPILVANNMISNIIMVLWPFFAGFAVIMFIYAGFLFLFSRGDVSKAKEARNAVIYGVVGVAVGLLAFSIPFVVKFTLGI